MRQYKLNLVDIPPKRQSYIYDTGCHGAFGTYKAFPTLIPDVLRGVHTKTREIRYFAKIKEKRNYYRYIDYYGMDINQ